MSRTLRLLCVVVPALAILVGLGTWQLYRLDWKQALIADMDARLDSPAEPLPEGPLELADWRFRPVELQGRFGEENFLFPARPKDGQVGLDVLTPFERADTGTVVMVHRGWAPTAADIAPPAAEGTIRAIVREPWRKTLFRPDNDPGANQWFWMELPAMEAALGKGRLEPYYLALLSGGASGDWPEPRPVRPDLPNNHLSYAFTWYALALALAIITVVLIRTERRKKAGSDHA